MTGRYSDFEELRPTGEASHVPDDRLSECGDGDPWRQRVATTETGYPDDATGTDTECRSCSASIPSAQTKCRFCLTNHLGAESSGTDKTASEATLLGVVHMVVESSTFYGAVAKGGAAATLLTSNETEQVVDDYTLIYDLDEEPATQLAARWPTLPAAVQVASADGEQLLAAARDRIGGRGQPESEHQQEVTTRLYDESGRGIRDESHLTAVLDDAGDEAWLVPAIALTETTDERESTSQHATVPTKEQLECRDCGRPTEHRFSTHESAPDETWAGKPIWVCQVCGIARYGQDSR